MKKVILVILALILVAVVGGGIYLFKNLNSLVKQGVETAGPKITKTEVKLDGVSLSPFSGSGKLTGLLIGNPDGYKTPSAIKLGEIEVAVNISSLKSDTIVIEKVAILNPEITFEGGLTGNNLKKIQSNIESVTGSGTSSGGDDAKSEKKIQVKDLTITGGKINMSITGMGGKSVPVPLPDIHLQNIGTDNAGVTAAELSKRVMAELMGNIDKVAAKAISEIGNIGKEAVNEAVNKVGDGVDKAAKGIKGLFGK